MKGPIEMGQASAHDISVFRSGFTGEVITSSDRDYDSARSVWNGASARIVFNISAACPTPELYQADRAWVRSFWEALRPYASGGGSYVNFIAEYEENRIRASYGAAKYEKLAHIKATYDPDNVFHLNANIKPA